MAKQKYPFQGVMVGRLVQGDCFVPQTKDQSGALRIVKSGPNAGQPSPQYFVAVAYRKDDPNWPAFMAMLHGVAKSEWPGLFPATQPVSNVFGIGAQAPANPLFTFKVKDGDGVDRNGKSNAEKDGFAGHWIVSYASSYPPKVVRPTGPNTWETVTHDPASGQPSPVKRGYYIRVAGSAASNDSANTPGIYVNLDMIEFVGTGPEIVGGVEPGQAFAQPAALPAGAIALGAPPAAGAAPPAPGAAPAHVMLPAAGGASYEAMIAAGWTDATLVSGGMMVAPVAPPPAAVTPPPPPPPPPPYAGFREAAPAHVMLPAAGGASYEAMIAAGWTDGQLVAAGMMQAPLSDVGTAGTPLPPAPPASIAAPPATVSPTKTMTAAAGGSPYETFIGAGWTDEQLVSAGYMVIA